MPQDNLYDKIRHTIGRTFRESNKYYPSEIENDVALYAMSRPSLLYSYILVEERGEVCTSLFWVVFLE